MKLAKSPIILCVVTVCFSANLLAATPPEGTFEWVSTEVTSGEMITPLDLGYTVQRQFNSDLTYVEYRNEEPFRSGQFWVADVEFMGVIIPALSIDYGIDGVETCAFGYLDNNLELFWGADGGGWPSFPVETLNERTPVSNESRTMGSVKNLYR